MDMWFYYDVTHRLHTYCNPISVDKMNELIRILDLKPQDRVLDIACGLGQLLLTIADSCDISGVGVDASPYYVKRALHRKQECAPHADIQFIHELGEHYKLPDDGDSDPRFDVVMLVGASWIWNGYKGTLDAIMAFCKPGGLIVIGEPYWKAKPPEEYLKFQELGRDALFTLHENVNIAKEKGLDPVYFVDSSNTDWDRYEMLQVASVDQFAQEEPNHPDLAETREKVNANYDSYLKWGREGLGFATHVFRKAD